MKKILVAILLCVFCTSVHSANNCTGATYYDANSDTCIPCATGTYSAAGATLCTACTNAPANATYTGSATSDSCPWKCNIGYYLNNNDCALCGSGGYYCPGDNSIYPCPSAQNFYNAAAAAEPNLLSISYYLVSWDQTKGIGGCRARPVLYVPQGQYYYSVLYNSSAGNYVFSSNLTKYWERARTGYYLYNHYLNGVYYNVAACTNAPANAHYTGAGTPDIGNCPWVCDTGYSANLEGTACNANIITIEWAGADGTYQTGSCTYGGGFNTPATPPTRRGYRFDGWTFTD